MAYRTRKTDIARAELDVDFHKRELERARQQLERQTISDFQYDTALLAYQHSQNTLEQEQQALVVARAKLIDPDMPTEEHPLYQQAQAELDLGYTDIIAPMDGIAVNASALFGESVIVGTTLLNVIDDSHLWIEANYKEIELTYVKPDSRSRSPWIPIPTRSGTAPSAVSPPPPAPSSACCRPRIRPATGSRSCNASVLISNSPITPSRRRCLPCDKTRSGLFSVYQGKSHYQNSSWGGNIT